MFLCRKCVFLHGLFKKAVKKNFKFFLTAKFLNHISAKSTAMSSVEWTAKNADTHDKRGNEATD